VINYLGNAAGRDVRLTSALRARGVAHSELARLQRTGRLRRVRRGAYAAGPAGTIEEEHRRLILGTIPQLAADACVSHQSAALLHGLPVLRDDMERVHVTRSSRSGGRRSSLVHVHPAPLGQAEVVRIGGLAVTSLARTVVDCARTLDFAHSVAIGDAAIRAGLDEQHLSSELALATGRVGMPLARRVCAFLDGRAESAGESLIRVLLRDLELPRPRLQFEIFDHGRLIARSDFAWPDLGTVGEFDGKIKYGQFVGPGESPGEVVFREKRREDLLRELGWEVVRWVWDDVAHPDAVALRLERAFARASRRTGRSA
jgi:hypothetical protein